MKTLVYKKFSFIKTLYVIIYLIAAFMAFDSLLTSDKWGALFSGFLIFGIVIHHSIMNEKIIN